MVGRFGFYAKAEMVNVPLFLSGTGHHVFRRLPHLFCESCCDYRGCRTSSNTSLTMLFNDRAARSRPLSLYSCVAFAAATRSLAAAVDACAQPDFVSMLGSAAYSRG